MMTRALGLTALLVLLAACGSAPAATGTGIQGTVEAGPTCPVERINSPCPPRPMAATVVIRDSHGTEVVRIDAGSDGHFKVDLPPGRYTLMGEAVAGNPLPRPLPTSAIVSPGRYTTVTVEYDSGIR